MTDTAPEATTQESKTEEPKSVIRCTFCQKAAAEVKKMVVSPGVYICDECVSLCVEIIDDGSTASTEIPKRARWEERLVRRRTAGRIAGHRRYQRPGRARTRHLDTQRARSRHYLDQNRWRYGND